jgi:DNA mismatch endonuclease (patch repair protein)
MDKFSSELRSKTMKAVHSKRTKLEDSVIKELWSRGLRFRRNVSSLPGKPDIALKKKKIVLFIDSCFWHGCPEHCRFPQTNIDYWHNKITRTQERDKRITDYYKNNNWTVIRVWEHDLKTDFDSTINKLVSLWTSITK